MDEPDFARVQCHAWHLDPNGYAVSVINGRRTYLHRFLMGCEPGDGLEVDHKNFNPLDCRRANLRLGTRGQNKQNLSPYRGSSSRYRGVCWNPRKAKWEASARVGGRRVYFERFDDEDEAGQAAADARRLHMSWSNENTDLPEPLWEEYIS